MLKTTGRLVSLGAGAIQAFVEQGRLAVADLLMSGAQAVRPAEAAMVQIAQEAAPAVGADTLEYLADLASESFKRQVDLDESVWRSLPFIAATFAFVAAITGRAASDVPHLSWGFVPVLANFLFVAALLSLAWTLRWFWVVLRRREYEYPADDAAVRSFAEDMTVYHAALGLTGSDLDKKVLEEMRLFMVEQYGSAARTNLRLNATRLEARSKVLLFILIGFLLAFLCEATIFVQRGLSGPSEVQRVQEPGTNHGNKQVGRQIAPDAVEGRRGIQVGGDRALHPRAAEGAQNPFGVRGRQHLGAEIQRQHPREAVMTKSPPIRPASSAPPSRPTPPPTQFVAKLNDGARGQKPAPTPTPTPTKKP